MLYNPISLSLKPPSTFHEMHCLPQPPHRRSSELCSLLAGFDASILKEREIELDDNECLGLLKNPGLFQNIDDFDGCPVKPQSLVASSKLMILASSPAILEVRANTFRCIEG
jgi:hypothetical protein